MLTRAKTARCSLAVLSACALSTCGGDYGDSSEDSHSSATPQSSEALLGGPLGSDVATANALADAPTDAPVGPTTLPGTDADWAIVEEKARWAVEQGLSELSIGELVVRIGETFVGTPYAPHTLEAPGEEGLVIELEELDCVTFVENVLALARFVQTVPDELLVARRGGPPTAIVLLAPGGDSLQRRDARGVSESLALFQRVDQRQRCDGPRA